MKALTSIGALVLTLAGSSTTHTNAINFVSTALEWECMYGYLAYPVGGGAFAVTFADETEDGECTTSPGCEEASGCSILGSWTFTPGAGQSVPPYHVTTTDPSGGWSGFLLAADKNPPNPPRASMAFSRDYVACGTGWTWTLKEVGAYIEVLCTYCVD